MTLSPETIAIITVGVALAGLNVTGDLATRSAARAEAQANRTAFESAIQAMQATAATDRRDFQSELLRLTREQARLAATIEQPGER